MLITHIPEDITNFFIDHMNYIKVIPGRNSENNSLTRNVWWSGNLTDLTWDESEFSKNCSFIKNLAENLFHCRLFYNYVHYIDYHPGGSMNFHSHEIYENFVFILYLNDCFDGETNFDFRRIVSLNPKKSQIVFFESDIFHSGSYSSNKQILVGGMTIQK